MSRNVILVVGLFCWTAVAVDAGLHLFAGDVVVPAGMALVFVGWVGLRRRFTAAHATAEAVG